jgi:prephenate dehydrogenase
VAAISHLPYLLSASLVATVAGEAENDPAVWQLAAGGFRDTSRLAGSDITMMSDILSTNTQAVATLLALFRVQMSMLEARLISQDHQKLNEALITARETRLMWSEQYERKSTR